ncbi:MAG TPA: alkaline phosphatase family protein [Lachnospiraceae bacterium]|nr:alkaline phosphatase family protein [Lachnospiraceae bacterium]
MSRDTKTIVISFDGLGTPDWDIMMDKPNFSRFVEKAAFCLHVEAVYPSLTYPSHATISTGRWPKNHGVTNNKVTDFHHPITADWYWYRKCVKGKTFYDVAAEKGMTSAALLWPTAGGGAITYNVPEIFQNRIWKNQIYMSLHNGCPQQLILAARYGRYLLHGVGQPYLDTFVHRSALYLMNRYDPDLIMIHYCDLDHNRHRFGHDSKQAMDALERHDRRLGDWMSRMKAWQQEKEGRGVNWVILGDHSSLDENKGIRLNRLLAQQGLLKLRGKKIVSAKVFAKEAGGSCCLYGGEDLTRELIFPKLRRTQILSDQERADLTKRLVRMLKDFSREHGDCIEAVYTGKEAGAMGADPNCLVMCEASLGYYFQESPQEPVIYGLGDSEYDPQGHRQRRLDRATHGYSPRKPGYTTVFAVRTDKPRQQSNVQSGDLTAKEGFELDRMRLIDEGPTIARMLGGDLPQADGRFLSELFEG